MSDAARSFFADTCVSAQGQGRYTGNISHGWDIGGNANGGYLMAIAARAMREETGRPDPVTITAHFLNPGPAGPCEIDVDVVKRGKRFCTASARMLAGGKPVLQVLGSFGDLGEPVEAHERVDAKPPELPSPDECGRHGTDPRLPPIFRNTDMRLHPDDSGFARGAPSGEPRVRGWFRFANEEPLDTVALLFAADAFPPTAFNARLPTNWTPTLELTVHLRARPMPGWLRAVFTTRFISGGLLEEDGELWDESGRIVAQSRQLALLPRARSASAVHDQG